MSRNRGAAVLLAAGLTAGLTLSPLPAAAVGNPASCPWVGSTAPVPDRVTQLLGQMTDDQKILLLHQNDDATPYVGNTPAIPALCIPALSMADGAAGVSNGMNGVTQLPVPEAAAATWDTAAEQEYGTVVGAEEADKGATVNLGPTINVTRDPRWGRAWETLGEDPYLSGRMGAAEIRGVQSQGVQSQVKHLAVYNQETNRNTSADNAVVSDRTMQEIYLPQFQTALQQAAPSSVMCAYSMVNGTFACENPYLLQTVLRNQFGYTGFVTSDWGGTHSTAAAANNGLDQDMQLPDDGYFGGPLAQAVQDGQVSEATLDGMVRPILTEMFAFGLFDRTPGGAQDITATTPAHAATATQVAEEGSVLLKNGGGVLPLSTSSTRSIAVIGDDAGPDAQTTASGGTVVNADSIVTPLQGIQSRAGSGVNVQYAEGGSASGASMPDVPADALTPSSGGGNGLTGQFYNNMTLSGSPVLTRNDGPLDFSWGGGSPGTGVNADQWSAKWTGTITPPSTGTYTFSLTSDDGSSLYVNGQQIINQWQDQAATTATGTVSLTAGKAVGIEVDYYQDGGGSSLDLAWAPPGSQDPGIQQAVDLARSSDVAVVFANNSEGEGSDLSGIDLPGNQNQLISAVAAANPRTIVVLNTGAAVTMPWLDSVAGVIEGWYPGQQDGAAIAALLFGDVDPSGKLPVTFPKSLADVPASTTAQWPGQNNQVQYSEGVDVGYRWYQSQGITPLFPFGYGLSYTNFAFSGLHVSALDGAGHATVTATVTNTGSREGADVAELYVGDPPSTGEPPQQLKGFQRVDLQPGQSRQVSFPLTLHDLAYWNNGWTTPGGTYQIMVGDSSASPQLSGSLDVPDNDQVDTVTVTDPQGMSGPVGTAVQLPIIAQDSDSSRQLTYSATGLPGGLSIDPSTGAISGTPTSGGTSTVTVTATDGTGASGSTTFIWTTITAAPPTGEVTSNVAGGVCLDNAGANDTDGNPIQIYHCDATSAQQWTVIGGGLRLAGTSFCMDATDAGTANGTPIQLYACNGTGSQVWQPQPDGTLLNPQSGRCLDDPAFSTADATRLELWDCGGGSNQQWNLP